MFKCKTAEFLFRYLPLPFWRNFLIRKHMDQCLHCQERLAGREEAKKLLVAEEYIKVKMDLWPDFQSKIQQLEEKKPLLLWMGKKWRYGLAGAMTVLLAGVLIFLSIGYRKPSQENGYPESFRIQYIKVHDQPAQSFLFQPKDSNMVFVWAEKKLQEES